MTQELLIIIRAMSIAWGYAVTLGYLYGVRLFWQVQTPSPGTHISRLHEAVEAALRTSPIIVLTGSMFALIAVPLAAWSVGSASWGSLKRYIYGFWLVLALFILVSGNPDGLVLISGNGLIALWFLRNRSTTGGNSQIRITSRMAGSKRNTTVFVILAVITCVLLLFLFFGKGTKAHVVEICAIYAMACIFQGIKVFSTMERGQNANHEIKL